jgi:polyhydroxybutyrate depolymerase
VPPVADELPGDHEQTLEVGDATRTYRLAVPRDHDPTRPAALVLNLHGSGSNALQAGIYSDLPRRAAARGMLVASPDAIDGVWELGATGDDADFLAALLDDLERRTCIDPDRIHLVGFSLGAWKAAVTACALDDRVASIALLTVEVFPGDCPPLPVLAFHGTADATVAYGPGGGTVDTDETPNAGLPGTRENVAAWADNAGCAAQPTVTPIGDDVELRRHTGCRHGGEVALYTIVGGGHTWPGSEIVLGPPELTTESIDATALVLDWFEAHPRRR